MVMLVNHSLGSYPHCCEAVQIYADKINGVFAGVYRIEFRYFLSTHKLGHHD